MYPASLDLFQPNSVECCLASRAILRDVNNMIHNNWSCISKPISIKISTASFGPNPLGDGSCIYFVEHGRHGKVSFDLCVWKSKTFSLTVRCQAVLSMILARHWESTSNQNNPNMPQLMQVVQLI